MISFRQQEGTANASLRLLSQNRTGGASGTLNRCQYSGLKVPPSHRSSVPGRSDAPFSPRPRLACVTTEYSQSHGQCWCRAEADCRFSRSPNHQITRVPSYEVRPNLLGDTSKNQISKELVRRSNIFALRFFRASTSCVLVRNWRKLGDSK